MEMLNVTTKEGFKNYIETQLLKFHSNYNLEKEEMMKKNVVYSSHGLVESFEKNQPTKEEIIKSLPKLDKDALIISLIYIERLLSRVGILLNHWNWKRISSSAIKIYQSMHKGKLVLRVF
jgi:hypothetical protein